MKAQGGSHIERTWLELKTYDNVLVVWPYGGQGREVVGSYINALNTHAVCVLLKWGGKSTDAYSFLTHVHSE